MATSFVMYFHCGFNVFSKATPKKKLFFNAKFVLANQIVGITHWLYSMMTKKSSVLFLHLKYVSLDKIVQPQFR